MSNRQQKEPWRNAERHYCKPCNAWMGSDRQSILLHENGRKHKENVETSLQQKRSQKLEEENNLKLLQSSLQKIEADAAASHLQHDSSMVSTQMLSQHRQVPSVVNSAAPTTMATPTTMTPPAFTLKQEKKDWASRKKKRQDEKVGGEATTDEDQSKSKRKRIKIEPGQGDYSHGSQIYLEGPTFYEILEEDMPVELWTGSSMANLAEKRLLERDMHWKKALVVGVRKSPEKCLVHVAYLQSKDDNEELIEKNVLVDRIRIVLGADESIPGSLEEARLLAMGGEEIKVQPKQDEKKVDEATGLSGWSTVTIKRTTVKHELKEERARLREQRKEAVLEKEAQIKETEARRMEEAKVSGADDSALGAYDVWGTGGYKGVDIQKEAELKVEDTAKSLASGKTSVAFKKKKKKPPSKRNQRTTSADDDED
jgi:WW domain-binding protein 4